MCKERKMKLKSFKNLKKAVAIALAGTMVFGMAGCGKKEEKKNKEKLPVYDSVVEMEFEGCIESVSLVDYIMYASYYSGDLENDSAPEENGVIVYDFKTKESKQLKIEEKDTYINSFYVDSESNIIVNAMKFVEKTGEETNSENNNDEGFEDENYDYSQIEFVYNSNLECISKEESELVVTNKDTGLLMDEFLMDVEYDSDGRMYSMYTKFSEETQENYIKVTDKEDKEIANISISEMADRLMKMSDGTVACSMWGENGTELYKIDVDKKELGEKIIELENSYAMGMFTGLNNSILLNEDGYLKRLNLDTEKIEKVFKFSDSEILADNVMAVFEHENGEFSVVLQDYETNKSEIDRLTKRDENSNVAKKEEIRIGAFSISSELQSMVIKFNKSNDKYKIVIDDYMSDDEDEFEESLKRFQAALTSSNCPDIIDLGNISMQEYARKGVLES